MAIFGIPSWHFGANLLKVGDKLFIQLSNQIRHRGGQIFGLTGIDRNVVKKGLFRFIILDKLVIACATSATVVPNDLIH